MQKGLTNDITRVGSAYTTFEAMFLEADNNMDQRQEELEFLENQIRKVGANIKRLCIDFVQEMFPQPFVDTEEDESYEILSARDTDEADIMIKEKEGIDDDDLEKEPCNSSQLFHSCSEEPTEVEDSKLSSEVTNSRISENNSIENQVQLEASDSTAADMKDSSLLLGSSIFDDVDKCHAKLIPLDMLLSDSVSLVHSCGSVVSDTEVSSSSTSPRSIDSSHDSVHEFSNFGVGLNQNMRLDESCIVIYGTELSSQSQGAEKLSRYEKTSRDTPTVGRYNSRQDNAQNPASVPCLHEEEASASLDPAFSDSDWEIV